MMLVRIPWISMLSLKGLRYVKMYLYVRMNWSWVEGNLQAETNLLVEANVLLIKWEVGVILLNPKH